MKRIPLLKLLPLVLLLLAVAVGQPQPATAQSAQLLHDLDSTGMPVAFHSDNLTLVVGFNDTLDLWNARKGTLRRSIGLWQASDGIGGISPDFKIYAGPVLNGSGPRPTPNTVRIYNFNTGRMLRTLTARGGAPAGGGEITAVAFSPNGRLLAGASTDCTTRLWDLWTGKLLRTFGGHSSGVWVLAFSPDGKTLATASGSSGPEPIRLWDVATGKLRKTLHGLVGSAGLKFVAGGKTLLAMGYNGALYRWNVATGRAGVVYQGGEGLDIAAVFTRDGKYCATATAATTGFLGSAGTAEVRETATGRRVCRIPHDVESNDYIVLSPDGKLLAIRGTKDNTQKDVFKIWRTR